jgi:hypothetical protein
MRFSLLLALAGAPLLAQTNAAPDPLDALVRDSPFLPGAGAARGGGTTSDGPLEFRGVVFEQGRYTFSIYDQASQQSYWVAIGDADAPIRVRSYDREQDIVTVEQQGRSVALKLQPGHVAGQAAQPQGESPAAPAPLPTAAQVQAAANGPGRTASPAGPGAPQPGVPNAPRPGGSPGAGPTAASSQANAGGQQAEAQRLQELADELRRRRQHTPIQLPKN